MEKVSVIVPVFNSELTIKACIESIINQSYKNIEIIVVDNASTDQTSKIIRDMSKNNVNIKCIFESRKGVSNARNTGIINATGKYISFIDSDDTIKKETISKLVSEIEKESIDLVTVNFETNIENFNKKINKIDKILSSEDMLKLCLTDFRIQGFCWNKMFKKSIIEKNQIFFSNKFDILEDLHFCIEYIVHINKAYYIDEKLYCYFPDSDSAMFSNNFDKKLSSLGIFEELENILIRNNPNIITFLKFDRFFYSLILFDNMVKNSFYLNDLYLNKIKKIFRYNYFDFMKNRGVPNKYLFSGSIAFISIKLYQMLRGKKI